MPLESVADFVAALCRYRLLDPPQCEQVEHTLRARFTEPRALARDLLQRGWLTPYQANQLLQDRGPALLLGSYVLLERIGEGGMGQVFKARNWKLGRVVALKVIRKERLANPAAVRRFRREIRAVAQLDHPNVVRAFDADEVDGSHFLVMEFVPGIDLARLVKQNGPPAVSEACDYARQTALGLQHVFERGLVHRDIKPSNLLLADRPGGPAGPVKILDTGLARLADLGEDEQSSSTMTREGEVLGTPDYMAPEQSLNPHGADIRADLYSLGCTLYFLLAGRPPFPQGALTEKLLRHQFDEPAALQGLRPDVPPAVASVVRRLMAKRPEDRFPTPAEAALHLSASPRVASGGTAAPASATAAPSDGSTVSLPPATPEVAGPPASSRRSKRRRLWLAAAGLLLAAVTLSLLLRPRPRRAETPPPPQTRPEHKSEAVALTASDGGWRVRAPTYEAVVERDGCLNSLRVGGVEFLGPGVPLKGGASMSRGAYFYCDRREYPGVVPLPNIKRPATDVLVAGDGTFSVRYEFQPRALALSLTNGLNADAPFYIIFDTRNVTRVRNEAGETAALPLARGQNEPLEKKWQTTTWTAGRARLTVTGGLKIWGPWKGEHQVWEARLGPRETRRLRLTVADPGE